MNDLLSINGRRLTAKEVNENLISLIKKSTLTEYIVLIMLVGTKRLDEALKDVPLKDVL